mmetsp:Transcript_67782/g.120135  ORF Transcript_67782/g.120135 Transcript_67782/m.120135 type:complete len:119 (-) Transcript_67782:341-697(-)
MIAGVGLIVFLITVAIGLFGLLLTHCAPHASASRCPLASVSILLPLLVLGFLWICPKESEVSHNDVKTDAHFWQRVLTFSLLVVGLLIGLGGAAVHLLLTDAPPTPYIHSDMGSRKLA